MTAVCRLMLNNDAALDFYDDVASAIVATPRSDYLVEEFTRRLDEMRNLDSIFFLWAGFIAALWDGGLLPKGASHELTSHLDTGLVEAHFADPMDLVDLKSWRENFIKVVSSSKLLAGEAAIEGNSLFSESDVLLQVGGAYCLRLSEKAFGAFAVTQHRIEPSGEDYFRLVPFSGVALEAASCREILEGAQWIFEEKSLAHAGKPAHIWCSASSIRRNLAKISFVDHYDVTDPALKSRDDMVGDSYSSFAAIARLILADAKGQ